MEEKLKQFLLEARNYPHQVDEIRHIETHISHIFLTGTFAYKFKKPVQFDFLDFSTLEKRRIFCEKEVLRNKRFTPELYLGVVSIRNFEDRLSFDGAGEALEYAVKMKQLDAESLFTELLEKQELTESLLSEITRTIARFHKSAELTPNFWGFAEVKKIIDDNIQTLRQHAPKILCAEDVVRFQSETNEELTNCASLIKERQSNFVKSLHGDLHLKNIALLKGKPVLFDGIEFNEQLSSCDVWADLAFLTMDLKYRKRPDFSTAVRNIYLEETDDYQGLLLLRLYESYRAAVRAKISCLEFDTLESEAQKLHASESAIIHLLLALDTLKEKPKFIVAVGGFSGSGKSTLSRALAQTCGAVHIRSDVIRKHILGLELYDRASSDAYLPEVNLRVYEEVRKRARIALKGGYRVIVDAVHGKEAERELVEVLASEYKCPFLGLWCEVSLHTAKERVRSRHLDVSDADEKIVEAQYQKPIGSTSWATINMERSLETALAETREHLNV